MPRSNIISSHDIGRLGECHILCTQKENCHGYNFRFRPSSNNTENCQLSNSTEKWNSSKIQYGPWVYYQDVVVGYYNFIQRLYILIRASSSHFDILRNLWLFLFTNVICTIYKMSGRSLSVYIDTSASHEYLCTMIKNGHEFCKLLLKRTQIVVQ